MWRIAPAMAALAAAVQFLHYALFQEDLLSLHYYWSPSRCCSPWPGRLRVDAREADGDAVFVGVREEVGLSWRAR